jgi:hypothetical protein
MRAAMIDLYCALPAWMSPRLRAIFTRIAQGDVPVLVHCAAGKDRTGIAVALLLTVLDVPHETIIEDYLSSREGVPLLGYYLDLALRSLRRTPALTALMIAAIGVGIGTSMTSLSVFRAMSGDPIPAKSHQLYMVQIDNWGPDEKTEDDLEENLSYIDAMEVLNLHAAKRLTRIYSAHLKVRAEDPKLKPVGAIVPAVDSDFFAMLNTPFKFGRPWNRSDDQEASPVVVIFAQVK